MKPDNTKLERERSEWKSPPGINIEKALIGSKQSIISGKPAHPDSLTHDLAVDLRLGLTEF